MFHSTITNWIEADRQGEKAAAREAIGQTRKEIAAADGPAVERFLVKLDAVVTEEAVEEYVLKILQSVL